MMFTIALGVIVVTSTAVLLMGAVAATKVQSGTLG
jgi:hypothetical protein